MSYYKQFIASSAAAAAAIIRSFNDVPAHVREFAATEVEKLKPVSDYALSVDLTGHSPFGTAPWEQASFKLETRWIKVMSEPEPAPELIRQSARPIERPDVEDTDAPAAAVETAVDVDNADTRAPVNVAAEDDGA